jgi:1-acyl-sn-glycerol-3-phosphate acyltransferase
VIFTFIEKAALLFSLCFFRMKYEGLENIPAGGGYLVCPNHRSYLDPIFVGCRLPLKRMRFMTKSEIMRRPVFSWILKKLGCFGIERGKSDIAAVETAEALVREGGILMIFPEGTRGHAAQMRPFKSGAAFVAKYTGAGVIPVAVDFTGQLRLFKKVTVRFGKLIPNEELGPSLHRASNLIRERIDAMLEAAKWS